MYIHCLAGNNSNQVLFVLLFGIWNDHFNEQAFWNEKCCSQLLQPTQSIIHYTEKWKKLVREFATGADYHGCLRNMVCQITCLHDQNITTQVMIMEYWWDQIKYSDSVFCSPFLWNNWPSFPLILLFLIKELSAKIPNFPSTLNYPSIEQRILSVWWLLHKPLYLRPHFYMECLLIIINMLILSADSC